jgi:hypothetical protein
VRHRARYINDLAATGLRLCPLFNFGKLRADIKGFIRSL